MKRRKDSVGAPADPPGPAPVVAIVGRPNAGKSTLVNRLCRKRVAIVADEPGMTRDRVYMRGMLRTRPVVLVDTGGFDLDETRPLVESIRRQLFVAVEEADVVVCLFDGLTSPTTLDEEIVGRLRRSGRPVVYAVNKTEGAAAHRTALEYHELGVEELLSISSAHGTGIGDLVDAVVARLPAPEPGPGKGPEGVRLAVMGRPNSGKSTLANTLLGEERMIVDERPGTTRDAVQIPLTFMGQQWILIDTAGMRRPRSISLEVEELSVQHAVRAIEVASVVLLLVDAPIDVAEQDHRLANLVIRRGRGLVVGMNKWDRIRKKRARPTFSRPWMPDPGTLEFVPVVPMSGLEAWNLEEVFEVLGRVAVALERRIPTSDLNRFLEEAIAAHQPPAFRHRPVKINYATQVATAPPVFAFFANHPEGITPAYRRYLENKLRGSFDLEGVPIRLSFRRKPGRRPFTPYRRGGAA